LGASRTTARLDAFGELPARGLVVGSTLATRKLLKACLHVGTQLFPRQVAVLQQSQCFADHFARRLVQTALNFFVDESFELWRERPFTGKRALIEAQARRNSIDVAGVHRGSARRREILRFVVADVCLW